MVQKKLYQDFEDFVDVLKRFGIKEVFYSMNFRQAAVEGDNTAIELIPVLNFTAIHDNGLVHFGFMVEGNYAPNNPNVAANLVPKLRGRAVIKSTEDYLKAIELATGDLDANYVKPIQAMLPACRIYRGMVVIE